MKHTRSHLPNLSYGAAFIIGVILFASVWKMSFGSASSAIVLAGMAGTAVAVTVFWLHNEIQKPDKKKNESGLNSKKEIHSNLEARIPRRESTRKSVGPKL